MMNQDIFNTQLFQKLNTLSDNPLSPTTSAPQPTTTTTTTGNGNGNGNGSDVVNNNIGIATNNNEGNRFFFTPKTFDSTHINGNSHYNGNNSNNAFMLGQGQSQGQTAGQGFQTSTGTYPNDVPFSQTRHQSISTGATGAFDPFGTWSNNTNSTSIQNQNSSLFFPQQQQQQQQQQQNQFDPFNKNSNFNNFPNSTTNNVFQLPAELQGGVSNISSRRPSYAAEFLNRDINFGNNSMLSPSHNHTHNHHFQQSQPQGQQQQQNQHLLHQAQAQGQGQGQGQGQDQITGSNLIHLDNGLLLQDNFIITSKDLKDQYNKAINYFGDLSLSKHIVDELNSMLFTTNSDSIVNKRCLDVLKFLKYKNDDLKFQTKNYTLILNKNNKIDLISIAKNSNLKLQKNDLIIIEGDRGKDLVLVLEPLISANFAILFNYLKKKLHLKSLTFGQEPIINGVNQGNSNTTHGNTHGNGHGNGHEQSHNQHHHQNQNQHQPQQQLINEDENFITLPNKQILRFVKPFEINQLYLKFNDELMTLKLCLNYILNLNLKLIIKNVEFQFDKKKIIIYYYCNKRLDFRGLIKELFKIYKTRIWLCAILPHDHDASNILTNFNHAQNLQDLIELLNLPHEITSISDFQLLPPQKFHGEIFLNLIHDFQKNLSNDESWYENYNEIDKFVNS